MAPLNSTRVAWSIAIASLALWATSAPQTWGQMVATADGFVQASSDDTTTTTTQTVTDQSITTVTDADAPAAAACPTPSRVAQAPVPPDVQAPVPPAIQTPVPPAIQAPVPPDVQAPMPPDVQAPAPAANSGGPQEGTFHLCGADASAAHAIEQLIAGRPFSANLSTRSDGCADLTIRVTSSTPQTGTSTSNLSVSLGSGQRLSIQIVTDGSSDTTHVNIS